MTRKGKGRFEANFHFLFTDIFSTCQLYLVWTEEREELHLGKVPKENAKSSKMSPWYGRVASWKSIVVPKNKRASWCQKKMQRAVPWHQPAHCQNIFYAFFSLKKLQIIIVFLWLKTDGGTTRPLLVWRPELVLVREKGEPENKGRWSMIIICSGPTWPSLWPLMEHLPPLGILLFRI